MAPTDKPKSADQPTPTPIPDFAKMSAAELMEFARKRMEDERASAEARIKPIREEADKLRADLRDIDTKRAAIIAKIADLDGKIRAIMPSAVKSAGERKPRSVGRDPRLPSAGTRISMKYKGNEHVAETTESAAVRMDGVEYASISAAARAVAAKYGVDTQIDGYRAFGLNG